MGGVIMSSIGFNSNGNFRVNGIERSFGNFSPYHLIEGGISLATSIVTTGFATALYTGNATSQSIITDVDMSTQWGNDVSETFGGLVWIKGRSGATNNYLVDTVRGATHDLYSNATTADTTEATGLTAFGSTGFNIGALAGMNTNLATYASWNFQTTHRRTGTTNHGKAYTEHYNPYTGFTIIKYEGSGTAGHEIPHSIGRKLGFWNIKNIGTTATWQTGTESLFYSIQATNAFISNTYLTFDNNNVINSTTNTALNASSNTYILYGWANSYFDEANTLIGNYEIGVYQGTGAAGNKVTTRGKPAWVMLKRLDGTSSWEIIDNQRTTLLFANESSVETTINFTYPIFGSDGFTFVSAGANDLNVSGGQYLYMVVYDNDSGSGKSKYPKATDNPTLNLNAKVPFANGVDANGVKNSIIVCNETVAGITLTQGKNYVYKKNDGTYGVNNVAPSYGNTNPANGGDFYNVLNNTWYTSAGVIISASRNYLDAIVWADQNGQIEYVEQLPKTVYLDEVKANEYKGKNACTAWVSFDGTTTPPTIRDSFNVKAVIRTGTGVYEIYFNTPMDNTNYTLVGTCREVSAAGERLLGGLDGYYFLNSVRVVTSTAGASAVNANSDVTIYGGKN